MNIYQKILLIFVVVMIFILSISNFSSSVFIKKSNIGGKYGRGVFSNRFYYPGEIIEIGHCISEMPIPSEDVSVMNDYIFSSEDDDYKKRHYCFGFTSIYNHADNFNANWKVKGNKNIISARKMIKPGEEITVDYGENYWKSRSIKKEVI